MKPTETNKESEMERMGKEERKMAERLVNECLCVAEKIKDIHDECSKMLNDFGWDVDVWDVANAGAIIGRVGLGIAQAIGYEDGWAREEVAK